MGAKQSNEVKLALKWVARGHTARSAATKYKLRTSTVTRAMHRTGLKVNKPGRPKNT